MICITPSSSLSGLERRAGSGVGGFCVGEAGAASAAGSPHPEAAPPFRRP
eukprot:COSAG01_NODE_3131_length_6533_cov_6.407212_7_plen_50_part_00